MEAIIHTKTNSVILFFAKNIAIKIIIFCQGITTQITGKASIKLLKKSIK
ncbi:MAG: hypothetical protein LBQ24_01615 [Candidatus Peribacteria bacterium]|jgi:hypothetical protein|nr:hypothetical protein [Candidatus Peribacteria bacterium]